MVRRRYWERITAAMFIAAVCASFATVGAIFLTGCSSAKQAIGSSAQSVNVQAANSKRSATQIIELAQATQALESVKADSVAMEAQGQIVTLGSSIIAEQDQIQAATIKIQSSLHRVEDSTPWWARLMSNLAIAGIVIGVIVLLWQTGLGMLIKRVVWSLGMFIPKATMRSAEADLKMLDNNNEMAQREAVAIRRTSDPAYEAARKKLKRSEIK